MTIELLNITIYSHYIEFNLLQVELGLGEWVGSLVLFEWHEGDINWDFMFLNGLKSATVG